MNKTRSNKPASSKRCSHLKISLLYSLTWLAFQAGAQDKVEYLLPESNAAYEFDYQQPEPIAFESFEQAAQWADVVAIAQVYNTDYQQTRKLNAQGQAYLTVRVGYKGSKKNDLLIVNAKGFEDHICYYPDRKGEGRRFLVFLKKAKNEGEYIGFKPICQMQILLTDTGSYVLRYPLDADINIAEELIEDMRFNDPYSVIDATLWTGTQREKHQKDFNTTQSEEKDLFQKFYYLHYSKGIHISHIRKLMNIPVKQRIKSKQM